MPQASTVGEWSAPRSPFQISTCTNVTRSLYGAIALSNSSSTGPQYIELHRAGVAKSAATRWPDPTTSDNDTVCKGHCAWRVQIGLTPSVFVVVGDTARG